MSPITLGGKPIAAKPAQPRQQALDSGITDRASSAGTPDQVLMFMRIVAMNLEARRDLVDAIRELREIDTDALNDPDLESHPQRPAMIALYNDRVDDERLATTRLMECNVSLERQWQKIAPADKHRYGLTFIIGEPDPQSNILGVLWCEDRGLSQLVPFPDDWTPARDISHRAFDTTVGVSGMSMKEALDATYPPF